MPQVCPHGLSREQYLFKRAHRILPTVAVYSTCCRPFLNHQSPVAVDFVLSTSLSDRKVDFGRKTLHEAHNLTHLPAIRQRPPHSSASRPFCFVFIVVLRVFWVSIGLHRSRQRARVRYTTSFALFCKRPSWRSRDRRRSRKATCLSWQRLWIGNTAARTRQW